MPNFVPFNFDKNSLLLSDMPDNSAYNTAPSFRGRAEPNPKRIFIISELVRENIVSEKSGWQVR